MSSTTACAHCGTHPSHERPALTWSLAVASGGHRQWTCAPCVREQLPAIESSGRHPH